MKNVISRLMILSVFSMVMLGALAMPAYADYGYENTISDCSSHEAWTENTGVTLEIYAEPIEATADSITMQFVPSFDDSSCTVKKPIGYDVFTGVTVNMTGNIQTPVGSEEVQLILNDEGDGELEYTFTGLEPATEYQFRVDGNFETTEGSAYQSVSDNEYYATSTDPVTDLAISTEGVVSWTWPEGDEANIKADIAFYEGEEELVSTVKYKTSAGEYDYYDFANKMYNGDYSVKVTPSTKKIYDLVDHRIWATASTLYFTTQNGQVISESANDPNENEEDVDDNEDEEIDEVLTAPTNKPVIVKAGLKKGIIMKRKASYYGEGYYYKIVLYKKKGKNKVKAYNDISGKSKKIAKKVKNKLKKGIAEGQSEKRYVRAKLCNEIGCGPWSKYKKFNVKK